MKRSGIGFTRQVSAFVVAIFLLTFAGCDRGVDERSQTPKPAVASQSKTKVKVGYLPSLAASQLYIGIVKGYFAEEGLDVEILEIYSGPEIVNALQSKSVDVAFGIVPPLVMVRSKGIPIKSIAGATLDGKEIRDHRILLAKDSPISKPEDLRGKKIALVAEPTSDGLGLLDYLEKNGVKRSDVQLIKTPHPEQVFAVVSKAVDAAASIEPFITIGLVDDKVKEFDFYYSDEPTEVGTYLVHEDLIKSKPELVAAFARAIAKATPLCQDHDALREILPTLPEKGIKFKVTPDVAQRLHIMGFRESLSEDGIRKVMEQLIHHGFMKEPIDVKSCIHTP